jgi:regulator of replication initiation timing
MTEKELEIQELKRANRRLFAENLDLKIENEQLKARIESLEVVKAMLEGVIK